MLKDLAEVGWRRGMVKSSRHFYTQTCSLHMGRMWKRVSLGALPSCVECMNVFPVWQPIYPSWILPVISIAYFFLMRKPS